MNECCKIYEMSCPVLANDQPEITHIKICCNKF